MSAKITNLTADTFKAAVAGATTPLLVDFWATWCGPCKAIAPILEELAVELDGKVSIAKVDIDAAGNDAIAAEYGIRAIPTMLLFKGGQLADQIVGMMPKAALKDKLLAKV
jgi:thioredoxin 1